MPSYRPERVSEMIHRELAERLRSEVKDPRVAPISITSIAITKDLSRAVVSYTPLGGGRPSEELVDGLEAAGRQLRGPIGRALRLRHAPEIVFAYDEHIDDAFRVSSLIERLTAERKAREGTDDAAVEPARDATDAGGIDAGAAHAHADGEEE